MGRFFKIRSMNLTMDPRERQWITMIFFARLFLTLQNASVPTVKFYELRKYSETNTVVFLFSGRLMVSLVKMSEEAKIEYGVA